MPFLGLVLLAYSCNQQHAYWDDGERRLELHFGWDPADDRLAVEEFLWKNYGLDNTFAWKLRIADPSGIPEIAAGGWVRLEPAGRGPLGAPPEPEAPWWGAEPHAAEGELWEYRGDEDFWRIWYDPTTGVAYIDYAEW